MSREHHYVLEMEWTGNRGAGTPDVRSYDRSHELRSEAKATILGSSDPTFRGDATRWNPEELLVAALSQCHMLWHLRLCAAEGLSVHSYRDRPQGVMLEDDDGSGRFTEVTLRPQVAMDGVAAIDRARELHEEAHRLCFIANSVNFPVKVRPSFTTLP